jgi:hypothetical protein
MFKIRCWTFDVGRSFSLFVFVSHQHDTDIHNIGSSGSCDHQISKGLKERVSIVSPIFRSKFDVGRSMLDVHSLYSFLSLTSMIQTSITLVRVGPVITRSPRD